MHWTNEMCSFPFTSKCSNGHIEIYHQCDRRKGPLPPQTARGSWKNYDLHGEEGEILVICDKCYAVRRMRSIKHDIFLTYTDHDKRRGRSLLVTLPCWNVHFLSSVSGEGKQIRHSWIRPWSRLWTRREKVSYILILPFICSLLICFGVIVLQHNKCIVLWFQSRFWAIWHAPSQLRRCCGTKHLWAGDRGEKPGTRSRYFAQQLLDVQIFLRLQGNYNLLLLIYNAILHFSRFKSHPSTFVSFVTFYSWLGLRHVTCGTTSTEITTGTIQTTTKKIPWLMNRLLNYSPTPMRSRSQIHTNFCNCPPQINRQYLIIAF